MWEVTLTAASALPYPLQYYSKDQGAICTKLVRPKRKQGTKSAEEELAKGKGPHPSLLSWPGLGRQGTQPRLPHLSRSQCQSLQAEDLGALGLGGPTRPRLEISHESSFILRCAVYLDTF